MAEHPFGHESPDVAVGRVLAALGILAVFVVGSIGVLRLVLQDEALPDHARVVAIRGMTPPVPRLQAHPNADIAAERAQKQRLLSSYAWLDASRSFARIPIQSAMQIYVEQHAAGEGARLPSETDAARAR